MKNLKKRNMDNLKSCLLIKQNEKGEWISTVINGEIQIPDNAVQLIGSIPLVNGVSYLFYHRPDCAWFTNETT
jgi:hypothetical protein